MGKHDSIVYHARNANCQAYLLLGKILDRMGLRKRELLAELAELGHLINDDTFTNWGRPGRSFPRDWVLIRDLLSIISKSEQKERCTAYEALKFCALVQLPFTELNGIASLFPTDEFISALAQYLSSELVLGISKFQTEYYVDITFHIHSNDQR
jgi:hypothetical protein